ncbi:unannotated protein [freshwater metagenome]|uniref:Unannotated protein n=1 Tax=freshwater metagenome TaxID=449393 RepID=A0A6J6EP15_9ZZZZ
MGNVEVAGEHNVPAIVTKLCESRRRRVEPCEFLFHLFGRGFVASVGVGGDDGECFALAHFDIGFYPAALVGEGHRVLAASRIGDRESAGNSHTRPPLH